MSFLDFAARMFPYWILGGVIFWAVWNSSHKDLLAFNKKSFKKFAIFLLVRAIYVMVTIKLAASHGVHVPGTDAVKKIPILATLFVGWEDMVFTLPLVLLRRVIGTKPLTWPLHAVALLGSMYVFGSGHTYEGITAAALISLYIPFGVWFSQKKGFRTLVSGHILWDFSTIAAIKLALM